jgi:hypothetical protein
MPSGTDADKAATRGPLFPGDSIDAEKSYRVMLNDIATGLETTDSFAIKFSLLTKMPVSKMKHIARRLPAQVWTGRGRRRAEHFLTLIEEAGGKGSIVEIGSAPPPSPGTATAPAAGAAAPAQATEAPPKDKLTCSWCGFPMKEGETHCGFCMTPAGRAERRGRSAGTGGRGPAVNRKRLVFYAVALLAGIVLVELLMR